MTDTSVREPSATEGTTADPISVEEADPNDATTRDRQLMRRLVVVGLAWALIWATILTFLFVFGDALSSLVV